MFLNELHRVVLLLGPIGSLLDVQTSLFSNWCCKIICVKIILIRAIARSIQIEKYNILSLRCLIVEFLV